MLIDRDTERIFADAASARRRGEAVAIATIVGVEGSAYRREGARMLIRAEEVYGVLSAGCLEDDAIRAGREVLATSEARLLTYDSRHEDDALWGWGSGCRGLIHVLVQIPDANVFGALSSELTAGRGAVMGTVVAARDGGIGDVSGNAGGGIGDVTGGAADGASGDTADARTNGASCGTGDLLGVHAVRLESGKIVGSRGTATAVPPVLEHTDEFSDPAFFAVERSGRLTPLAEFPRVLPEGTSCVVLVEPICPAPRVLIIGAGADAVPLSAVAVQAGFRTMVADHRPAGAVRERFPDVDEVLATAPERMPEGYITPNTYVVVMTHQFEWDSRWLALLADSPAPYIGLIGPRERTRRLFEHLEGETGGSDATRKLRPRLYNPVGLDVGGRGPGPIAVAVAAEILAVLHGRAPDHLRNTDRSGESNGGR